MVGLGAFEVSRVGRVGRHQLAGALAVLQDAVEDVENDDIHMRLRERRAGRAQGDETRQKLEQLQHRRRELSSRDGVASADAGHQHVGAFRHELPNGGKRVGCILSSVAKTTSAGVQLKLFRKALSFLSQLAQALEDVVLQRRRVALVQELREEQWCGQNQSKRVTMNSKPLLAVTSTVRHDSRC